MKVKVLIVCHMNTFFTELFRVSKIIKQSAQFEPLFLFHDYPNIKKDIKLCQTEGILCYNYNGEKITSGYSEYKTPKESFDTGSNSRVVNAIKYRVYLPVKKIIFRPLKRIFERINQLAEYKRTLINLQQIDAHYQKIFSQLNPKLILVAGDQVGYDTPVLISAGHKKKMATIVIPSTMSNGIEQAEVYYHDFAHSMDRWINKYVAKKYPKWVFEHKGRKLLRVNGERALALEKLGISPPLPWIFQSGFSDAIAVESEAMREYYLENGLPNEQLVKVGSPVNDTLFQGLNNAEELRNNLYSKYNLPLNKPMILTALPCDCLYYPGGRPECEFREYGMLAEFWIRSLAEIKEYNIIVSLHPSVNYSDMKHLEDLGVKIANEDISFLIPLTDIFVASVSSTIRWAVACNKPTINYDIYRCRYTDFNGIAGVLTVEKQNNFKETLEKLSYDKDFYKEMKRIQKPFSETWGQLDGLSGKRILNLMQELSN